MHTKLIALVAALTVAAPMALAQTGQKGTSKGEMETAAKAEMKKARSAGQGGSKASAKGGNTLSGGDIGIPQAKSEQEDGSLIGDDIGIPQAKKKDPKD